MTGTGPRTRGSWLTALWSFGPRRSSTSAVAPGRPAWRWSDEDWRCWPWTRTRSWRTWRDAKDWQDKGRRFDLIVCGHAWHWIDPTTGVARAGTLLRPGGTIARFWNFHVLPPDVLAGIDQAYQRHAPGPRAVGHDPDDGPDPDSFEGTPPFVRSETITYRWKRDMTADEWVGLIATFSDHQRLGVARLAALQEAVRQQIDSAGGRIQVHGGTYTRLATRN
jgi:hypothetical protein